MITTEGSPRVHSSCLPDTCSNPYLAREAWGYHGHWGNGEGDAPMGWRWRNQKDQQAGKGMKGGKEPNCTPSPAFLESHQCWVPGTVEPLLTPTSPNLSSTCLAPEASGKFLWEQGSFHISDNTPLKRDLLTLTLGNLLETLCYFVKNDTTLKVLFLGTGTSSRHTSQIILSSLWS